MMLQAIAVSTRGHANKHVSMSGICEHSKISVHMLWSLPTQALLLAFQKANCINTLLSDAG